MNENEFKNYYQILGIDKSLLDYVIYDKKKDGKYEDKLRNEASKDKKIKEAYNKKVEKYTKVLNDISLNPEQRKRAEDILKKAKEYYEKINTKEKRDTYKKELDLKEEIERK